MEGYSTGSPSIWALAGPFGRPVSENGNSRAARKPPMIARLADPRVALSVLRLPPMNSMLVNGPSDGPCASRWRRLRDTR